MRHLLERIPKVENLPYAVIDQIKRLISSGALKQGMKLPTERELSEQLGVGRSSIREALRILQFCQVVDVRHGVGTYLIRDPNDLGDLLFVRGLVDDSTVLDLLEARIMLEVFVVGIAAESAEQEDLDRLRQALADIEAAGDSFQDYFDADLRFHECLALVTRSRVLIALMRVLHQFTRDEAPAMIKTTPLFIGKREVFGRIVECIEQGDSAGARELMRDHMEGVSGALVREYRASAEKAGSGTGGENGKGNG